MKKLFILSLTLSFSVHLLAIYNDKTEEITSYTKPVAEYETLVYKTFLINQARKGNPEFIKQLSLYYSTEASNTNPENYSQAIYWAVRYLEAGTCIPQALSNLNSRLSESLLHDKEEKDSKLSRTYVLSYAVKLMSRKWVARNSAKAVTDKEKKEEKSWKETYKNSLSELESKMTKNEVKQAHDQSDSL